MAATFGSSQQLSMPIDHVKDPATASQGSGHISNHHTFLGSVTNMDPLTNHLANMSKHQLYEIMSQMKGLIQQNQCEARLILVANPQLTKALFQAQIMLGMVLPPEASQIQALQQSHAQASQPIQGPVPQINASTQQPTTPVMPSLGNVVLQPPRALYPQQQANVNSQQPSNLRPPVQALATAPTPPLQPAPTFSRGPTPPPLPPFPPPVQGQLQVAPSMTFQSSQRPAIQQQGGSQFNIGMTFQQHGQPPLPAQPPPQQTYQVEASIKPADSFHTDPHRGSAPGTAQSIGHHTLSGNGMGLGTGAPVQVGRGPSSFGSNQVGPYPPLTGTVGAGSMGPVHPLGTTVTNAPVSNNLTVGGPTFTPVSGTSGGFSSSAGVSISRPGFVRPQMYGQVQMQAPQQPQQIPMELEQHKALLQQVMNLTTEQINSLPPEQRQQVIQLQQALR